MGVFVGVVDRIIYSSLLDVLACTLLFFPCSVSNPPTHSRRPFASRMSQGMGSTDAPFVSIFPVRSITPFVRRVSLALVAASISAGCGVHIGRDGVHFGGCGRLQATVEFTACELGDTDRT